VNNIEIPKFILDFPESNFQMLINLGLLLTLS